MSDPRRSAHSNLVIVIYQNNNLYTEYVVMKPLSDNISP